MALMPTARPSAQREIYADGLAVGIGVCQERPGDDTWLFYADRKAVGIDENLC